MGATSQKRLEDVYAELNWGCMRLTLRVWSQVILCSSDDVMIRSFFVDSFIHVFFVAMQVGM